MRLIFESFQQLRISVMECLSNRPEDLKTWSTRPICDYPIHTRGSGAHTCNYLNLIIRYRAGWLKGELEEKNSRLLLRHVRNQKSVNWIGAALVRTTQWFSTYWPIIIFHYSDWRVGGMGWISSASVRGMACCYVATIALRETPQKTKNQCDC